MLRRRPARLSPPQPPSLPPRLRRRRKERGREEQQQEKPQTPAELESAPRSRLAELWDEERQADYLLAPSGLGALAENRMRAAIKEGALENLKGKGECLGCYYYSLSWGAAVGSAEGVGGGGELAQSACNM